MSTLPYHCNAITKKVHSYFHSLRNWDLLMLDQIFYKCSFTPLSLAAWHMAVFAGEESFLNKTKEDWKRSRKGVGYWGGNRTLLTHCMRNELPKKWTTYFQTTQTYPRQNSTANWISTAAVIGHQKSVRAGMEILSCQLLLVFSNISRHVLICEVC